MSTLLAGRPLLWRGLFAGAVAALVLIAFPAIAMEGQPSRTALARITTQSDAFIGALDSRVVMPLDVRNASRWDDVLRRQEASVPRPCADTSAEHCFATFWNETVATLKALPRAEQVRMVNGLVNEMGYWSDRDLYREADYWATPEEMFDKMGGDCEDFALFKYFLLRAAGVPADELRLTLVASDDQAHMVALAMVDGAPVMLDCVALQAVPPSALPQYKAVYSLSETGAWFLTAADGPVGVQTALADMAR
ncbi:MAG: transglutaminase-like cysteine peptidase [Sphingomonadales bacterium]